MVGSLHMCSICTYTWILGVLALVALPICPALSSDWTWLLRDSNTQDGSGPFRVGDINGDKLDDYVYNATEGPSRTTLIGIIIVFGTTAEFADPLYLFDTDMKTTLVSGAAFRCSGVVRFVSLARDAVRVVNQHAILER
eukprot:m51a1_g3230 hypothetical protein (139) ;mRNA; f:99197-104829